MTRPIQRYPQVRLNNPYPVVTQASIPRRAGWRTRSAMPPKSVLPVAAGTPAAMLPSLSPAEYFPIRGTPSQGEAWRQFREFLGDPLGGAPNERGGPVVQADVGRAAAAARLLLASPWLGAREAPPSIATLAQTGDLSGTTIRNLLSAAVSSGLLLRASLPGGAGLLVVQPTQDGRDLLDRAAGRWRQASAGLGVALRRSRRTRTPPGRCTRTSRSTPSTACRTW